MNLVPSLISTIVRSKITSKNRVTIPKTVRDFLEVGPSDAIEWQIEANSRVTIAAKKQDLWDIVAEQEKKFGNVNTKEIDWREDIESEGLD